MKLSEFLALPEAEREEALAKVMERASESQRLTILEAKVKRLQEQVEGLDPQSSRTITTAEVA